MIPYAVQPGQVYRSWRGFVVVLRVHRGTFPRATLAGASRSGKRLTKGPRSPNWSTHLTVRDGSWSLAKGYDGPLTVSRPGRK